MDKEELERLLAFLNTGAQQDATANPPTQGSSGTIDIDFEELLGKVAENVVLGQDPTGASSLFQDPEREMLGVQLLSGLVGMAVPVPSFPTGAAGKVLKNVQEVFGGLADILNRRAVGESLSIDRAAYEAGEGFLLDTRHATGQAIHDATSRDIAEFVRPERYRPGEVTPFTNMDRFGYEWDDQPLETIDDFFGVLAPKGVPDRTLEEIALHGSGETGNLLVDLFTNRSLAELGARAMVHGDPVAKQAFSIGYPKNIDEVISLQSEGWQKMMVDDELMRLFSPREATQAIDRISNITFDDFLLGLGGRR